MKLNLISRRTFVATAGASSLAGCASVTLKTLNFRIIAEDVNKKVIGSGVRQWRENVPAAQFREYLQLDGEAFPLKDPGFDNLYVLAGDPSGRSILEAYQAAGAVPKFRPNAPISGIGAEGFEALHSVKATVQLLSANGMQVITFRNKTDPFSWRSVYGPSWTRNNGQRRPNYLNVTFYVRRTSEVLTDSIPNELPWLRTIGGTYIWGEESREPESGITRHAFLSLNSAVLKSDARGAR